MIEVGKIFHKNGYTFCVIDVIEYANKSFALCSIEKEKLEYAFYEIVHDSGSYNLLKVTDDTTEFALFDIVDKKEVVL